LPGVGITHPSVTDWLVKQRLLFLLHVRFSFLCSVCFASRVASGHYLKNVNRTLLSYLLRASNLRREGLRWFDLPCGGGEFPGQVGRLFPGSQRWGADVGPATPLPQVHYQATDLNRDFPFSGEPAFDIITSISSIMCFGNTAQFIGRYAARLAPAGLLLVSNDNCLAVRDQFSYLVYGSGTSVSHAFRAS
jgi:hypothetical protein